MRNHIIIKQLTAFCTLLLLGFCPLIASAKLVIAQGGASGYITQNSLPAIALAVSMGADIIKLDVVLSGDQEVLVLNSPKITTNTNVAEIFPKRKREDGQFYVFDFSLAEIQQLSRRNSDLQRQKELPPLRIHTLRETIAFINILNKSLGKESRIAIELRQPWLHRKEQKDISMAVLKVLQQAGSIENTDILSYDAVELGRIRKELAPQMGVTVGLVQLIESNEGRETMVEEWGEWVSYNYDWMFSKSGLRALSATVTAIGLPRQMLADSDGNLLLKSFVENAQQLGTMIFAYSVTGESNRQLSFANSFDEELEYFYFTAGVDGVVTDLCREARSYLNNRPQTETPAETENATSADPLQLTQPTGLSPEE